MDAFLPQIPDPGSVFQFASGLDLINALSGKFKKCVILDLDNTTWGGVIGDDGIDNIQIGSIINL